MEFTDEMIREVLFALQHPEVTVGHAESGSFEAIESDEDANDVLIMRPRGRHFRDGSEPLTAPVHLIDSPTAKPEIKPERRLAVVGQLSREDELHTLTRDYIVAATNHVVRKLERVG